MKTWQEKALEYSAQGLRPCDVTRKIESELGMTGMYNKVRCYIRRHAGKTKEEMTKREQWAAIEMEMERMGD